MQREISNAIPCAKSEPADQRLLIDGAKNRNMLPKEKGRTKKKKPLITDTRRSYLEQLSTPPSST
jgi:hypothetical protein